MFYVVLLYALFASVFTISKTGLMHAQPFFLVGTRMLLAGVILVGYQLWVNKQTFQLERKTWIRLLLLALFNIYLTNVFEFWGLQFLPSYKACFIYSLSPFLSALFCYFLFAEKLSSKKWIGLLVGFVGFLPILLTQTFDEGETGQFFIFSWAEIAVMLAAVCSVYGWIILKQLVNEDQLSPLTANGMSMLMGGAFALAHSFAVEEWHPVHIEIGLPYTSIGYTFVANLPVADFSIYLECTLLLILISNFICYNLYGFLLKRYSAPFISFAGFTTPLFSALFGWFFLHEFITWPFYLSFTLVFTGLALFNQEELKQSYQLAQKT